MAGLKIEYLDGHRCEASVPFGWRTQNPFGSIYFAALAMAAELSCAGLALSAARSSEVSMSVLPIQLQADFVKKATDKTVFRCEDGLKVYQAAEQARISKESVQCFTQTTGSLKSGLEVARFNIEWSFRVRA